jgi:hypothetical protein
MFTTIPAKSESDWQQTIFKKIRQKNSRVDSGSGSLPSE